MHKENHLDRKPNNIIEKLFPFIAHRDLGEDDKVVVTSFLKGFLFSFLTVLCIYSIKKFGG